MALTTIALPFPPLRRLHKKLSPSDSLKLLIWEYILIDSDETNWSVRFKIVLAFVSVISVIVFCLFLFTKALAFDRSKEINVHSQS